MLRAHCKAIVFAKCQPACLQADQILFLLLFKNGSLRTRRFAFVSEDVQASIPQRNCSLQALEGLDSSFAHHDLTDVQTLHALLKRMSTKELPSPSNKGSTQALAASVLLRQTAICLVHFGVSFLSRSCLKELPDQNLSALDAFCICLSAT